MRISFTKWIVVGAIACLLPACDRDTEPQRRTDKVNDEIEHSTYVERTRERLAEADRRIESLEKIIATRTGEATRGAKHEIDEAKRSAREQTRDTGEAGRENWRVSLDEAKKMRSDLGSELDELGDKAQEQWRLKERQTQEQLRELEKQLEELEQDVEKSTVKALEKIEEAVRGAKQRLQEEK